MLAAMASEPPRREVIHGDAVEWLATHPALSQASVLSTIPDVSEIGTSLAVWLEFFRAAARASLLAAPDEGLCVFFQTDIKREGRWVSKAALVLRAADELEIPLLFHKVVCRRPPGTIVHGRPGFSHLLGFSRRALDDPGRATADVLPDLGVMPWSHSMGTRAAEEAVRAVRRLAPATTRLIVPFCGIGTALAVANAHGLDVVGIERNRKRAEAARTFALGQPRDEPSPDEPTSTGP